MNIAGPFSPYTSAPETAQPAGTMSLSQIRDFLSRQWRLITAITGFCIVLGIIYIALSPFRYTAQADMIIDTKRVTWTQSEMASENHSVDDAQVESEIETTKSEKVVTSVIRRLHLDSDPEFVGTGDGIARRVRTFLNLPVEKPPLIT